MGTDEDGIAENPGFYWHHFTCKIFLSQRITIHDLWLSSNEPYFWKKEEKEMFLKKQNFEKL